MSENTTTIFISTAKGSIPLSMVEKGKDYLKSMEMALHSFSGRKKIKYLSPTAQEHLEAGKEAFEQEDYDMAIIEFFEVVVRPVLKNKKRENSL